MSIDRKTACRDDLRARILTLDLAPGTDLDEAQLAAMYGLSRTPLREVLQGLAAGGYLSQERNRSARVTTLDLQSLRAMMQSAPVLLCSVARLAAMSTDADGLDRLRDCHKALLDAIDAEDAAAAALADHHLFEQITERASDPYLRPAVHRLLVDHTRLGVEFFTPSGKKKEKKLVKKTVQSHDALIAAISAADPEAASAAALARWALSRDRLERMLLAEPLPTDPVSA